MTQNELITMHTLCGELIEARDKRDAYERKWYQEQIVNEQHDKNNSSLRSECNDLREREADALNANEDLKKRCTELMAERDDARRKLGALTLCVGFLKDYDTRHPKKSLEAFKEAVKRCIDDNHIVLTEGGVEK